MPRGKTGDNTGIRGKVLPGTEETAGSWRAGEEVFAALGLGCEGACKLAGLLLPVFLSLPENPIWKVSCKRQKINAISAASPKWGFGSKVYSGTVNATVSIEFLQDFMKSRRNPVLRVVKSLPAHKLNLVGKYFKITEEKLGSHFLPTDAPDLDPDEFVWN